MIGKLRRVELSEKDPDLAPNLSAVFRMLPQSVAFSASTPASNAGQPWCSKVSRPARGNLLFIQTPQSAPKMPASTTTVRVIAGKAGLIVPIDGRDVIARGDFHLSASPPSSSAYFESR